MKKTSAILYLAVLLCCNRLHAQLPPAQQKAILVKQVIELNHYSPRAVDDSFSASLFRKLINTIDAKRVVLTAEEYKLLSAYRFRLDDELQGNGWAFADLLTSVYKKSLQRADSIVAAILQKPFDFTSNESITVSPTGTVYDFSVNTAELSNRWSRYLKLTALDRLYDMLSGDSVKNAFSKEKITKLEPAIRNKIIVSQSRAFKTVLEYPAGIENMMAELYLNALATSFDPHTNYFSAEGKEQFKAEMSTEEMSFGLEFEEDENGKIIIYHLVPGGPAWKSGELNKGDELLQLQFDNKEPEDASDLSGEDVEEMLETQGNQQLVIKVKKANSIVKEVTLRKEKISNEENIVKSFVLKGDKKIGYILLPGFYTQWENETGSGCANDVAKEIIKLKRDKIDGLIIDVRHNGGGSMQEGLELTGIFIEEGPLTGQKDAKGKVYFHKDPYRGIIYDGPLAVMVNGRSASASELMSAALQDYHRAVIVGSPTFGKASIQRMLPVEKADIAKVTCAKFYRLDGSSAQLKGVIPDVALPDAFGGLSVGERYMKNALTADSIPKNNYYKPLPPLPVAELAKRSIERTRNNTGFEDIRRLTKIYLSQETGTQQTIPLKWDSFEKWKDQLSADMDIIRGETNSDKKKFETINNEHDKQWLQQNKDEWEINKTWLENITADIYIHEAYLVVCDLIDLLKPASKN